MSLTILSLIILIIILNSHPMSLIILRGLNWDYESQMIHFLKVKMVPNSWHTLSFQELLELNLERKDLYIIYHKISSQPFLWFSLFSEAYIFWSLW